MSRLFWFLIVSILFCSSAFGTDVGVSINFDENIGFYSYVFEFDSTDNFNSFSFEKPRDATLLSALDDENNFIRTSVAGDYYIVYPESTKNTTFTIDFESKSTFDNILENNAFTSYFTFNFDIDQLSIELDLENIDKNILTVNPRDYTILDKNILGFVISDLNGEEFLQVEFSPETENIEDSSISFFEKYFYIVLSFLLLIVIFAAFFLRGYFKSFKKNHKKGSSKVLVESEDISNSVDVTLTSGSDEKTISEEIPNNLKSDEKLLEKKISDYMEKYLTENEKEVVLIVKEFNGIPQNEILHHLPSLTKSNLSKIITKLHGKQVLSRIRVGKINKIYLGDNLNFKDTVDEENK